MSLGKLVYRPELVAIGGSRAGVPNLDLKGHKLAVPGEEQGRCQMISEVAVVGAPLQGVKRQ